MRMKGSDIAVRTLIDNGISTVAGIPGGSVLPLYDSLVQSPIRHILARSEQGAAFIAQGMARSTGKPAVCIATSGPGATNLITAIADAYHDSVPLVAITGQVPRAMIGTGAFQEIDIASVCEPITKKTFRVMHACDIARAITEAFECAMQGRKGPVLIDIPKDVFTEEADYSPHEIVRNTSVSPDNKSIHAAARMISEAHRPMIIAGGGVTTSASWDALRTFAEKNSIPVAHTLMGIGVLPQTHPLYAGLVGMHGSRGMHRIIAESDCIIVIGSRLSDRVTGKSGTFAPQARMIRIDIGTALGDSKIIPDIDIHTGMETALPILSQLIELNTRTEWISRISRIQHHDDSAAHCASSCHPSQLVRIIAESADKNAIITTDVGQHQFWMAQHYPMQNPRSFLTSGGLGTMGFGLPAAIGAAIANPDRQIICATGDGSLMMNIQELATLSELNLNITIVVFNNGHLGLVRQQQELFYGERYAASSFSSKHDFRAIAHAFGIRSERISADKYSSIKDIMEIQEPLLIDADIDSRANVFPIVPPGESNNNSIMSNRGNDDVIAFDSLFDNRHSEKAV